MAHWRDILSGNKGVDKKGRRTYAQQREYDRVVTRNAHWKEIIVAAACHYVLRRAGAEPADFLSVLEGLLDYRGVEIRDDASSLVLGPEYPKVLREVRRILCGKSAVTNFGVPICFGLGITTRVP